MEFVKYSNPKDKRNGRSENRGEGEEKCSFFDKGIVPRVLEHDEPCRGEVLLRISREPRDGDAIKPAGENEHEDPDVRRAVRKSNVARSPPSKTSVSEPTIWKVITQKESANASFTMTASPVGSD
jgi:hypothetical protein